MSTSQIPHQNSNHKASSEFSERPRKKLGKYFYLLVGIGGAGLVLLFARPILTSSSNSPTAETTARILPVDTIAVEPVDSYQVSRIYTGEIAALRTSNLGFSRSGEIEQVLVEEGDRVTAGQPLAKLDIRNLETQRQQLIAEKARAQAQLAELQRGARQEDIDAAIAGVRDLEQQLKLQEQQRQRREFLYEQGAISKEELDEFSFGEGALQARLNQAKSNLAELENGTRWEQVAAQQATVQQLEASIADLDVTIDKSTLKAPFDGIVATRELDEGTVANAGQSVIRLIENAAPEARVGMPNQVINELEIGSTQTLKLGSQTYKATVASILPEVNANTRTQVVVFNLDRSAIPQINPGQTVRLELTEEINTEGYWLPTDALNQGIRGLWTCYVLSESEDTENYQVKQHSVEIIHQQGDRVLVRGTLQPGDKIVANGTHRLVPGQQVKPLEVMSNK
ncbi:efflux RND transporter periplasmic adaptor subunit [Hyella patelloides]|nr:efflux RND transporter periplasmic adaptor subunit [Hyella patelloides]